MNAKETKQKLDRAVQILKVAATLTTDSAVPTRIRQAIQILEEVSNLLAAVKGVTLSDVEIVSQYRSSRVGGTCDPQRHGKFAELYAPALQPDDWYLITVVGKQSDGEELELGKIVVKR